jgi:hypothetical protein
MRAVGKLARRLASMGWLLGHLCLTASLSSGQDTVSINIPRVTSAPKLEDFLDPAEGARDGVQISTFRQREPKDGAPVSQNTSAYLSYDDRNIYVVFVCKDEPGKVRAHMSKREDLADDDRVSVYLDTFRDSNNAYIFTVNPLGPTPFTRRAGTPTEDSTRSGIPQAASRGMDTSLSCRFPSGAFVSPPTIRKRGELH